MARNVIAVVDDLFFASKIRGAGEQAGVQLTFVKSIPDAIRKARDDTPVLIIADMNAQCCDPIDLARSVKSDKALSGIQLLGFFSHVQTELQQAAKVAGFDRVLPRSAFTKHLAEILAETSTGQDTA